MTSLAVGTFGSSVGSNGFFDYTMVQTIAGARVSNVPTHTELRNLDTGEDSFIGSRLYTEEDPAHGINGPFKDPGHVSINRMGNWHIDGGDNYIALDGSSHRLPLPPNQLGPRADYFWGRAPSGNIIPISNNGSLAYGWWNSQ